MDVFKCVCRYMDVLSVYVDMCAGVSVSAYMCGGVSVYVYVHMSMCTSVYVFFQSPLAGYCRSPFSPCCAELYSGNEPSQHTLVGYFFKAD